MHPLRLFLILLLLLAALPAGAQETIRRLDAEIAVRVDGSIEIVETIDVEARGLSIRRGIFRDIPTVLLREDGGEQRSRLRVLSVSRNGAAEPYVTQSIRQGTRIRIGDADTLLPHGSHRYQIRYTMDRAVRMFEGHDELYWNATGHYWEFPIAAGTTSVILPSGARILELEVFTGPQGATGRNARAERVSDREARFTLTAPLTAGEGMTVAVAFEKGVVVGPAGLDALGHWLSDHRGRVVPLLLVGIVLLYNGLAWSAVGRDPPRGVIFPRFHPPKGFSPGLLHYVHRMGWSGWRAFSAALVSLAVKGLATIKTQGKTTTLAATGAPAPDDLPPGEKVILTYLSQKGSVEIDKRSGPDLAQKHAKFIRAIENENRDVYFRNHTPYVVVGALLGVGALVAMLVLGILHPGVFVGTLIISIMLAIFFTGLRGLWRGESAKNLFAPAIFLFFGANVLASMMGGRSGVFWSFPSVAAISIGILTVIFGMIMRAPTVHGREVMDEIDGFKMYLETAEKQRLNFSDEPEMTVGRFERILPYAMALGVEKPWTERFEHDLARHAVSDAPATYAPRWYGGGAIEPARLASTLGGVAAGLSAAMVAAQPAQASSSGFSGGGGGGGFSGGGGGGGGGGGW